MGIWPKETVDPGAACSRLPPRVLSATATVIFKEKLVTDRSLGPDQAGAPNPEAPAEVCKEPPVSADLWVHRGHFLSWPTPFPL